MSHSYKERSYFRSYLWGEDNCSNSGGVRGGIGPSKTYFYYQKYSFGRDRHGGAFQKSQRRHTAPPYRYLGVWVIQLVLLMVIYLVLLLDILKVVWVLGSPPLTHKNLIVGLMVTILCYQVVDNIHP